MAHDYRKLDLEAPDFGAIVSFLGYETTVQVYLDHTHSPPTLRIEVNAASSDTASSWVSQSFAVELPEPDPIEEEEEEEEGAEDDSDDPPDSWEDDARYEKYFLSESY